MNAIQYSTIRPGYLVSLKSSVTGNVRYDKRDKGVQKNKDGSEVTEWETVRTITNKKEYDAAHQLRSKARNMVRKVCAVSAFGLLCPDDRQADLEKAIKDARELTAAFNAKTKLSRVDVYVIAGRVAQDDLEAVRAIKSELRDLLDAMRTGVKNLDAKAIREAASKARSVSMMLAPDAQARVKDAIDKVRSEARKIVKAGETAGVEIDKATMAAVANARTAFLDLEDAAPVQRVKTTGRGVDLEVLRADLKDSGVDVDADASKPAKVRRPKARQLEV